MYLIVVPAAHPQEYDWEVILGTFYFHSPPGGLTLKTDVVTHLEEDFAQEGLLKAPLFKSVPGAVLHWAIEAPDC